MTQVEQINIKRVVYDINAAEDATNMFDSDDSNLAPTYTDVKPIQNAEKRQSILNKVSTMFKNVRHLRQCLDTPEGNHFTTINTVSDQLADKAPKVHHHNVPDIDTTKIMVNSTELIPVSALVYKLNERIVEMEGNILGKPATVEILEVKENEAQTFSLENTKSVILLWENPVDENYKLTKIIQNTDHYPVSIDDGVEVYSGTETQTIVGDIVSGTKYYWSAFVVNNSNKVSNPVSIEYKAI